MLFFRHHQSNSIFEDDLTEVYYVDGEYVTAVNLFLIFCAIATPLLAFFGGVIWISKHIIIFYAAYVIIVALMIMIQSRHTRKRYMLCCYVSTVVIMMMPFSATLVYIFPIIIEGKNISAVLSVIFSVIPIYGGALLAFSINKMLKSGISCLIVSLIYFFIGALVLYVFLYVDSGTMNKVNWSTVYTLWA